MNVQGAENYLLHLPLLLQNKIVHYIWPKKLATPKEGGSSRIQHIDPDKLHRWPAHSTRVGAAVRLHNAGKAGSYIQPRLRWRSMTFMFYLQNTTKTSDQQHVD